MGVVHNKLILKQLDNSISELVLEHNFTIMLITQNFHSLNNQAGFHGFLPLLAIGSHKLNIDCSSKEIHDSLGANGIIRLIRLSDC